jgi:hypothetical protein
MTWSIGQSYSNDTKFMTGVGRFMIETQKFHDDVLGSISHLDDV